MCLPLQKVPKIAQKSENWDQGKFSDFLDMILIFLMNEIISEFLYDIIRSKNHILRFSKKSYLFQIFWIVGFAKPFRGKIWHFIMVWQKVDFSSAKKFYSKVFSADLQFILVLDRIWLMFNETLAKVLIFPNFFLKKCVFLKIMKKCHFSKKCFFQNFRS